MDLLTSLMALVRTGPGHHPGNNFLVQNLEFPAHCPCQSQLLDQVEQFGNLRPPQRKAINIHDLLDRARNELVHVELERVSPLAVPAMVLIGRERTPQGSADDELLLQAESLASEAMRVDLPIDLEGD